MKKYYLLISLFLCCFLVGCDNKPPAAPVAVDLGLPSGTKWANCNVGATAPEEYGGYYAWGETEEKSDYSFETDKYSNGGYFEKTKYSIDCIFGTVDNKTILEPCDDVATVKWGGAWRMPTFDEFKELKDKCTWEWATLNGVYGYQVTGPNGNSIFLPAAGNRYGSEVSGQGAEGAYWSSSLNCGHNFDAYYLGFSRYHCDGSSYSRSYGLAVRPVCGIYVNYYVLSLSQTTGGIVRTSEGSVVTSDGRTSISIAKNKSITLTAIANEFYSFVGWYNGDTLVSTETEYTLIVNENKELVAKFNLVMKVDLGLPSGTKWASCNVGATFPWEYGSYYAWGETEEKSDYRSSTYKYNAIYGKVSKYCTDGRYGNVDNKTTLEPSDDVAHVIWGDSWRMPTNVELEELRDNCTWKLTSIKGVLGCRLTGPNGNSIFLPAAGYTCYGRKVISLDSGQYWSSTLNDYNCGQAGFLGFNIVDIANSDVRHYHDDAPRYFAYTVRPVCK